MLAAIVRFIIGIVVIGLLLMVGVPINIWVLVGLLVITIFPVENLVFGFSLDPTDPVYHEPKEGYVGEPGSFLATFVSFVTFVLFLILVFILI